MPAIKPTRGLLLNKSHPLVRGLVGFWLLNEGSGTTVEDLSGNGNNGIIGVGFSNESRWSSGKFGHCVELPTTYDRIDIGAIPLLLDDSGDKSVNFFIWMISTTNKRNWSFDTGTDVTSGDVPSNAGMAVYCNYNTSNIKFAVAKDGTDYVVTPTHKLSMKTWYMVTGVFEKATGTAKLYIDGVYIGSATNANVNSFAGDYFRLGAHSTQGLGANGGKVDVLSFYDRALFASEIALLYRELFCMVRRRGLLHFWSAPAVAAAARRSQVGFRPIEGADRLRGLRRNALY